MPSPSTVQVTNLLLAWGNGVEVTIEPLVARKLKKLGIDK
jgi:hypothetical protein